MYVSVFGVTVGSAATLAWLCSVALLLTPAQRRSHELLLPPLMLPLGFAAVLTVTSAIVVSAQPREANDISVQGTAIVQRLENGTSILRICICSRRFRPVLHLERHQVACSFSVSAAPPGGRVTLVLVVLQDRAGHVYVCVCPCVCMCVCARVRACVCVCVCVCVRVPEP